MAKPMRRKTMKKSRGSRRMKGGNLFPTTTIAQEPAQATPPATVSGSKPPSSFSIFDASTWKIFGGKRRTNKRKH